MNYFTIGIDKMESDFKHFSDVKDADYNWTTQIMVDIPAPTYISYLLHSLKNSFSDKSLKSNNKSFDIVCLSKAPSNETKLALKGTQYPAGVLFYFTRYTSKKDTQHIISYITSRYLPLMVPNYMSV